MICDICGGTLVMQPGAIAKCDCCGMDYSTESLRAKFASAQSVNNSQTDAAIVYNNNANYEATTVDREHLEATADESSNLFEQILVEDAIPKKLAEVHEEIDENEEFVEEDPTETNREYIDVFCPGCFEKLSFFSWQFKIGEQFICPYCGESFVLKQNQILY